MDDHALIHGRLTHDSSVYFSGCIPKDDLDLVFVVDPKTGSTTENRALWKFVRQSIAGLDLSKGNVRVRFVRDCADVPEITLDQFMDKSRLLDELSRRDVTASPTSELLRQMTLKLKGIDGDRPANSVLKRRKVRAVVDFINTGMDKTSLDTSSGSLFVRESGCFRMSTSRRT